MREYAGAGVDPSSPQHRKEERKGEVGDALLQIRALAAWGPEPGKGLGRGVLLHSRSSAETQLRAA